MSSLASLPPSSPASAPTEDEDPTGAGANARLPARASASGSAAQSQQHSDAPDVGLSPASLLTLRNVRVLATTAGGAGGVFTAGTDNIEAQSGDDDRDGKGKPRERPRRRFICGTSVYEAIGAAGFLIDLVRFIALIFPPLCDPCTCHCVSCGLTLAGAILIVLYPLMPPDYLPLEGTVGYPR
jgi:hypothetical protein